MSSTYHTSRHDAVETVPIDLSTPIDISTTEPMPIVVAVAGDDCSESTIRLTESLVAHRHAVPTLLYVMALSPVATLDGGIGVEVLSERLLDPAMHASDEAELRRVCHADAGAAATWPFLIELGEPASSLIIKARQTGAKLLVMGLHHHGRVSRILGDDTLRAVISLGGLPVLATRPSLTALPQTIVAAMDFSQASLRAARLARQLLADGGTMHLAFIESTAAGSASESEEGQQLIRDNGVAVAFDQVRRALDPDSRVTIHTIRRRGDPVAELKTICESVEPDVIAIGSQRHPWLDRVLIGSVAKAIASDGRWSVLITPPVSRP